MKDLFIEVAERSEWRNVQTKRFVIANGDTVNLEYDAKIGKVYCYLFDGRTGRLKKSTSMNFRSVENVNRNINNIVLRLTKMEY